MADILSLPPEILEKCVPSLVAAGMMRRSCTQMRGCITIRWARLEQNGKHTTMRCVRNSFPADFCPVVDIVSQYGRSRELLTASTVRKIQWFIRMEFIQDAPQIPILRRSSGKNAPWAPVKYIAADDMDCAYHVFDFVREHKDIPPGTPYENVFDLWFINSMYEL